MAEVCQPGTVADHAGPFRPVTATIAGAAVVLVALVALLAWGHAHSFQAYRPAGDVAASGSRAPHSADPQILATVGLGPSDVGPGYEVSLLDEGDQLTQPTLDFCGLRFASEADREARRQVAATDSTGLADLSTEAVLYRDQAGAAQAMGELRGMRGRCPSGPVQSPAIGEPSLVWRVRDASTDGWSSPGAMDRVALDVTVGRPGDDPIHQVVVYLRRGRLLLGVYFGSADGPQVEVRGISTISGTIDLFQQRVAALPAADVS
jgi:hypothetical protein